MIKTIRENKKWRILLQTSDGDDHVLGWDFHVGGNSITRCRFRLGQAVAKLERKKWFFWKPFWSRQEMTNSTNVVQEWIAEYFSNEESIKVYGCDWR